MAGRSVPPDFWFRPPGVAARLLSPLATLYGFAAAWRMARPGRPAGVPVICIGNLTVGGAGKTPLALEIGRRLISRGERPVFLTRGHGGSERGPRRVLPGDRAARVGDEPLLLARLAPTIVARDRVAGAAAAVAAGASVIVMDDGFQNPSLIKDRSLIAVDGATGFGNGFCLPAGPLRAPLAAQLPRATALVVIGDGQPGEDATALARRAGRPVLRATMRPDVSRLAGTAVLAFAGIGRPSKFFDGLEQAGIRVAARIPFPDHHAFTEAEAGSLLKQAGEAGLTPVTTEKDHVRLAGGPLCDRLAERAVAVPARLTIEDDAALDALLATLSRGGQS